MRFFLIGFSYTSLWSLVQPALAASPTTRQAEKTVTRDSNDLNESEARFTPD